MAEGFAKAFKQDLFEAFSAGVARKKLDPLAVQVMKEVGIDISQQTSKEIQELPEKDFDYVITLCDNARESCPVFSGKAGHIHQGFLDPSQEAQKLTSQEEILTLYRQIRDALKTYVLSMPENLEK